MGPSDQAFDRSSRVTPSRPDYDEGSAQCLSSPLLDDGPYAPSPAPMWEGTDLSNEEQLQIFRALQDGVEGAEGQNGVLNFPERQNIETLPRTKRWLEQLWNDNPEKLVPATALLADASRERKLDGNIPRFGETVWGC